MRSAVLAIVLAAASYSQQIIDVHVSAEPSGDELTREWAAGGIVGGVAHPPPLKPAAEPKRQAANVISCAAVDDKADLRQIEAGLKERRVGCLKVYLGYVHRYASHLAYKPFYELAAKYDVPVIFHTGDTSSKQAKLKYADPLTVDEVAVDHPSTTFVLAHCGNPWIESAAEVAYKNPNVYLECSALLAGDLSKLPAEKVDMYVVRPIAWIFGYIEDPSKLMFGSGWPLTKPGPYVEAYKKAIPKQYWPQVFHDNAARIFNLPRR